MTRIRYYIRTRYYIWTADAMDPTTPEAVLERLAEWRDGGAWVECTVGSHNSSFGYRVVGLVADFADGFIIGSSLDRCAANLSSTLFRRSELIEFDGAGALHLRFPHAYVRISEIEHEAGHA